MTPAAEQFPFIERASLAGQVHRFPDLPIVLGREKRSVSVTGLLDTGAMVNVLPYSVGVQLGAIWEQQTISMRLSGNLAECEARALLLTGTVGRFNPVPLAFAWVRSENAPVILGQINFFREFDVCFFRSRFLIEVRPRSESTQGTPSN